MILHIMQQADNRDAKVPKAYNNFRVNNLSIYHITNTRRLGYSRALCKNYSGRKSML
jgi:hypothetical protein